MITVANLCLFFSHLSLIKLTLTILLRLCSSKEEYFMSKIFGQIHGLPTQTLDPHFEEAVHVSSAQSMDVYNIWITHMKPWTQTTTALPPLMSVQNLYTSRLHSGKLECVTQQWTLE